ncbi:MAG: lipopolysaccharide assembly protein LapA domain-containing protein [Pseudomonadota bacterium]
MLSKAGPAGPLNSPNFGKEPPFVLRRIFQILIVIPIALVLLLFMVANRKPVLLSLDPFSTDDPALAFQVPLFLLIFAAVLIGLVLGGAVVWARQHRYRKLAREEHREVERLKTKVEAEKTRADTHDPAVPTPGQGGSATVPALAKLDTF